MDWNNRIKQCLVESRFDEPPQFSIFKFQCDELARLVINELAEFWTVRRKPQKTSYLSLFKKSNRSIEVKERPDSQYLKRCPQALKELYLVLKRASSFLQDCSGPDLNCLKTAVSKADTKEALFVHIHDLRWCVVGLHVALQRARGETCSDLASRIEDLRQKMMNDEADQRHSNDVCELKAGLDSLLSNRSSSKNHRQLAQYLIETVTEKSDQPYYLKRVQKHREIVGKGGYTEVWAGSWLGVNVACKQSLCELEMKVCRFRNPFILRSFGIWENRNDQECIAVMERLSMDLGKHIQQRRSGDDTRGPFSLPAAVDIMLQISRGLEYLHEEGVVHRDIKPHNILVEPCQVKDLYKDEGYVRIKICDFGSSNFDMQDKVRVAGGLGALGCGMMFEREKTGTCFYMAPEMIEEQPYTFTVDVYSFSMACFEILTGQRPFESMGLRVKTVNQLITEEGTRPELPPWCPEILTCFIQRCWHTDPLQRPHFRDITKFLLHLKLVLMRVKGSDEDFESVSLTEYECEVFARFRTAEISLCSAHGSSIQKETAHKKLSKFCWTDLFEATNNFSRENRVGYGSVFKGRLPDGREVVVKRLYVSTLMLDTEAQALAMAAHENVIRLLGYCDEDWHKLLVYDYTGVQGTLGKCLFHPEREQPLGWRHRCKIALGVARGLAYLHSRGSVIKFEVGAESIVVDEEGEPKLCNFNGSEVMGVDERCKSYGISLHGDEEEEEEERSGDVLRFGMLLLEMVRGVPNHTTTTTITKRAAATATAAAQIAAGSSSNEADERKKMAVEELGRVMQLLDPSLAERASPQEVQELVQIALQCTITTAENRPTMQQVFDSLKHFVVRFMVSPP